MQGTGCNRRRGEIREREGEMRVDTSMAHEATLEEQEVTSTRGAYSEVGQRTMMLLRGSP